MGSNPVEALIFFRLLLSSCLNWKIYCDDHSSLSSTTAVQIWIISYILHNLFVCPPVRPFVHQSVCLSICLSIRPSVCLSICLSILLSVSLSVCLSIRPSVCLSYRRFVQQPVLLSICLSVCLLVHLSICLPAYFSIFSCIYVSKNFAQRSPYRNISY